MKILALLFIAYGIVYPQSIKITFTGAEQFSAALYSLEGEKTFFVDSIKSIDNARFEINATNLHTGFYNLALTNNHTFVLICDREDAELNTDINNLLDSMKVIKSESNRLFYSFLKLNKEYKTKTDLLYFILINYPPNDDFYMVAKKKLFELQNEYLHFVNNTSQITNDSYITRYIRSSQLPVINLDIPFNRHLDYLKLHALDNVDFLDASLVYSDAFTNKTIEYLNYFRNPNLPRELLGQEFEKAIDSILSKAKVNDLVYQHITEYLIDGFKKFGFDEVVDYIVENYVIKDDICLGVELEKSLNDRIKQTKIFTIGFKVPNIILPDTSGQMIELKNITNEKILLLFYSVNCPHCEELIIELNKHNIKRDKNIEIMAISLDIKKSDWINFLGNHPNDWINVSDLQGWESQVVTDYSIYATPALFLLDKSKKVIARPNCLEDILKIMKQ